MIDHRAEAPLTSGRAVIDHVKAHSTSILEEAHEGRDQTDIAVWEQGDDTFTTPAMDTHFLAVVLGGSSMVEIDFAARTGPRQAAILPGSLCYVPAGNACSILFDGRFRTAHVMLSAALIAEERRDMADDADLSDDVTGFISEYNPAISAACLDLVRHDIGHCASGLARSKLEHTLARRLVRSVYPSLGSSKRAQTLSGIQIKQAVDYIEDRVFEDFVLSDVAAFVSSTVPTLMRSFEEEVGISPTRFHAERRVDHIRSWVAKDAGAVPRHLAQMAGYRSTEEMDLAFRNVVGVGFENYCRGALY